MWQRSKLKKEARDNLRQNYFAMIAICFLMAFLALEYSGTTFFISNYSAEREAQVLVKNTVQKVDIGNRFIEKMQTLNAKEKVFPEKATKGVLFGITESFGEAKASFFAIYHTAKLAIMSNKILFRIFSVGLIILELLILIFVRLILVVGERRFFLENKNHPKTRLMRVIFLYRERKVLNPAKVMAMKYCLYFLWSLTIVAIPIKWYSYKLVPYILAENPDIKWREAISLSKEMMRGNKFRAFLLDISFWYWYLIKWITFGIFGVFFLNPYLRATEVELYVVLREEAIAQKIPAYEKLNDFELYLEEDAVNIPIYPGVEVKHKRHAILEYRRDYSLINLIFFFFTFSIIGWLWEVSLHLIRDGVFVNRGTMHGPWLPIYGAGGIAILLLLKKVRERPVVTFFLTMVTCAIVEYSTSFFLEHTKGIKWWDYSGYLLNLNGRICLEGLLVFALGGCAFIYILAPVLDDLYNKISHTIRSFLVVLLIILFSFDFGYSYLNPNQGDGITVHEAEASKEYGKLNI